MTRTTLTFPACKWLTYYIIEEFIMKCITEKQLKLLVYIYKKWMQKLTRVGVKVKPNINILYNYNIYMSKLFL